MHLKSNLVGALLLMFLFSACKKEVDELPTPTQTGANTFGARINGTLWVPARFGILPATNRLEAFLNGPESVIITARNFSASPTETILELQITGLTGPGTYQLNQNVVRPSGLSYAHYIKRTITPEEEYLTSSQYTGTVEVTRFDRVNRIISGTFQFTAGSLSQAGQTLTVTDGRFDVKFE